jgi:hypothetical protein
MPSSPHDLHSLALRVEAEHQATAKRCEQRELDELDRRRRELAEERSRLFQRMQIAAGAKLTGSGL